MNIEELENAHLKSPLLVQKESKLHTKLSIQFAVEILEDINPKMSFPNQVIIDKIQELKQYLDETNKD